MLSLVVNDKLRVRRDYLLSQWNQQIQVTLTSSLKDWGGGIQNQDPGWCHYILDRFTISATKLGLILKT